MHQIARRRRQPEVPARAKIQTERRGPAASDPARLLRTALGPRGLSPADVLRLQRTLGNRATGGLLAGPALRQALPAHSGRGALDSQVQATLRRQGAPQGAVEPQAAPSAATAPGEEQFEAGDETNRL